MSGEPCVYARFPLIFAVRYVIIDAMFMYHNGTCNRRVTVSLCERNAIVLRDVMI